MSQNINLNSPRVQEALKRLQFTVDDVQAKKYDDFYLQNIDPQIQLIRYNHHQQQLQKNIKILNKAIETIDQEANSTSVSPVPMQENPVVIQKVQKIALKHEEKIKKQKERVVKTFMTQMYNEAATYKKFYEKKKTLNQKPNLKSKLNRVNSEYNQRINQSLQPAKKEKPLTIQKSQSPEPIQKVKSAGGQSFYISRDESESEINIDESLSRYYAKLEKGQQRYFDNVRNVSLRAHMSQKDLNQLKERLERQDELQYRKKLKLTLKKQRLAQIRREQYLKDFKERLALQQKKFHQQSRLGAYEIRYIQQQLSDIKEIKREQTIHQVHQNRKYLSKIKKEIRKLKAKSVNKNKKIFQLQQDTQKKQLINKHDNLSKQYLDRKRFNETLQHFKQVLSIDAMQQKEEINKKLEKLNKRKIVLKETKNKKKEASSETDTDEALADKEIY